MKKIALVVLVFLIGGLVYLMYDPVNELLINIDGEQVVLENPVKTDEQILLLPAELIFEKLGFETVWDSSSNILSANIGNFLIELPVGKNEITANGQKVQLETPVVVIDDIVHVPVRALLEAIGLFLEWDEKSGTISIATPQEYFDPARAGDQEGPILNVAYPPASGFNYYGHSLFVFGTTESYSEVLVTVNGEPVDIIDERTGNYLSMLDIPRGEEFLVIVEATNQHGTTTVERTVTYPGPWQAISREPLLISSTFLIPAENQILKQGDIITIAFQGSPGAEAFFWFEDDQNRVTMRELAYPAGPSGPGGIYTAAYTISAEDVPAGGQTGPESINVALRLDEEVVTLVMPGQVTFLADEHYRTVEVKREHELKNRGWLYRMADGPFQLYGSPAGGAGYSTSVVSYLVEGTRYEAVGMSGNYYRVNLFSDQIFLIHNSTVRVLEGKGRLEPSVVAVELLENEEKISLTVRATERFPFLIADELDQLEAKMYGLKINEDLSLPYLRGAVNDLWLEPNSAEGTDSYLLGISLDENIAGFNRHWDGTNLIIDIYRQPVISSNEVLKGKTIIVDPGHGGDDTGAIGPGDFHEKDVVLEISLYLKEQLEESGANVVMTRTEDQFVNLYDRPERIDQYEADLFISVHANAHAQDAPATEIHGVMTLYNYAHNEELAQIMLDTMTEEIKLPAFRTWRRNIAVLRHPHIPSVLVEVGYMMHPEDNWYILHPRGQQEFARAMKEGLKEYFLTFAE